MICGFTLIRENRRQDHTTSQQDLNYCSCRRAYQPRYCTAHVIEASFGPQLKIFHVSYSVLHGEIRGLGDRRLWW